MLIPIDFYIDFMLTFFLYFVFPFYTEHSGVFLDEVRWLQSLKDSAEPRKVFCKDTRGTNDSDIYIYLASGY